MRGWTRRPASSTWNRVFGSRSGRYFANPYLVDWALARALEGDESAQELRDRLAGEILASMNEDHSFGLFDVPMSSAFAILSLAALGRRDRTLLLAQLRLMDFMERGRHLPSGDALLLRADGGRRRAARDLVLLRRPQGDLDVGGRARLAGEKLARQGNEGPNHRPAAGRGSPRYGCRDHAEYVQRFALPPYLNGSPRV